MPGYLHVLNVGKGHLEINFDNGDEAEVEKAKTTIQDMLKRGYLIVLKDAEGEEHKVTEFDPTKNCYIIKEVTGVVEVPLVEAQATAVAPAAGG